MNDRTVRRNCGSVLYEQPGKGPQNRLILVCISQSKRGVLDLTFFFSLYWSNMNLVKNDTNKLMLNHCKQPKRFVLVCALKKGF